VGCFIQTALSRYVTQILQAVVVSPEKQAEDACFSFKCLDGGV